MARILLILGKLDGAVATGSAIWGMSDTDSAKLALLVAGIAGAVGTIINLVSHYYGGPSVAPGE